MVLAPHLIKPYLYKLDDIETYARKRFSHCTFLYLMCVSREFVAYFRYITTAHADTINGPLVDALYFYFNERLREIYISKCDLEMLVLDIDDDLLFPEGHQGAHHSNWIYK